jgi:hypothetical protein
MSGPEDKIRPRAYELGSKAGRPTVQKWTSGCKQSEK